MEETLRRFGSAGGPEQVVEPAPEAPAPGAPTRPAPVDLLGLNELTGGDVEFAADLVQSYVSNSRELLTRIRDCFARGDWCQLARVVHQLAGASANVHAVPLRHLCSDLERAAETATAAQLERHVAEVAAELTRVTDSLASIVADSGH